MRGYLGIDIGTSGCKAAAFDELGRTASLAQRDYDVRFSSDGGAELDSAEVIQRCLDVIDEAGKSSGLQIRAMAVSSQGEAFTAVSQHGQPLCNAMISSDTRAAKLAREWPSVFGESRLYEITGHTAHPMFTLFKLLWLKQNRPEVWSNTQKFLCFEDLLHLRLGLEPAIGWPLAGRTMLFDVRKHQWSPEILDAAGFSSELFARPLPSGSIVGRTRDGTLVVAGGHDQPCGALGAGIIRNGTAVYATGTVDCITPAFSRAIFSETLRVNNLCTYDHAAAGLYTTVAFSLTGGNILKWFRNQFAEASSYEEVLAQMPAVPTRLLVLPYWTPSGTPHFDCDTPGVILGLRLSTSRGELIRALLEGVAMEMRLNLQILEQAGCPLQELRAIGGGARCAAWNQLKADVLGKPLIKLEISEAGCLGAAILACSADTGRTVRDIAADWVKMAECYQPDPHRAAYYNEQFDRYRGLRSAIRPFYA